MLRLFGGGCGGSKPGPGDQTFQDLDKPAPAPPFVVAEVSAI